MPQLEDKEAEFNGLWKLRKCMYGLVDRSSMWYIELRDILQSFGMEISAYDESLLYYYKKGIFVWVVAVHVDDLIFCGNQEFETDIINPLKVKFRFSTEIESHFAYTGLDICQGLNFVNVSQVGYADQITEIAIEGSWVRHNKL